MTVRWVFTDPVASTTYTFDINPLEGGSPQYVKNVGQRSTLAPDGDPVLFEGQAPLQESSFSGTILQKAHYDAFRLWAQKKYLVEMEDDLGRVSQIYITSFKPTRVRSAVYAYKHTYVVEYVIVSITEP